MNSTPKTTVRASPSFRVVVIEPRREVGFVLKRLLERDGHDVHHVADGREAVELSGELAPDIVMSAIASPGFDGLAVAREIVKRVPTKPLMVAVTSFLKTDIGTKLREAGFNLYLPKPVSRETLLTTVKVRTGGTPAEETLL